MKNWIACLNCSILFRLSFAFLLLSIPLSAQSQSLSASNLYNVSEIPVYSHPNLGLVNHFDQDTTRNDPNPNLPDPKSVMYKSMIIPGWGQIVNKQIWKVPIVYGMIGGIAWYSIYTNSQYHDYRAAYYNLNPELPDDLRFGPTPSYIPEDANLEEVRTNRNKFRNRRDLLYVCIALAYGLQIVDAYVFAHMRSFDVSEDLSLRTRIEPGIRDYAAFTAPGVTFSVDLITK